MRTAMTEKAIVMSSLLLWWYNLVYMKLLITVSWSYRHNLFLHSALVLSRKIPLSFHGINVRKQNHSLSITEKFQLPLLTQGWFS